MSTTYTDISALTEKYGEKRIAELSGDPQGTAINDPVVQKAIDYAASTMNVRIRVHYPAVPFDETNQYLRRLNTEGAYLELLRQRDQSLSDEHRRDFDNWMDELEQIAKGLVDLGDIADGEEEREPATFFQSDENRFGRNKSWDQGIRKTRVFS